MTTIFVTEKDLEGGRTKHLVSGVEEVKEAIIVPVRAIDLSHGKRRIGHAIVLKEERD